MYIIPYEADFKCPKGHNFTTRVSPLEQNQEVRCPQCLEDWIAANVPDAKQVSEPREVRQTMNL